MLTTVTGVAIKANGQPAGGVQITAVLSEFINVGGREVTTLTYTTQTSGTGRWTLALPVTADPSVTPEGAYYTITEPVSGLSVAVGVPASASSLDVTQLPVYANLPPSGGSGGWEEVPIGTDSSFWSVSAPQTCLADVAPTLPVTITTGVNDQFTIGYFDTFAIAQADYATLADLVAAMAAAIGQNTGNPLSDYATPSADGGKILVTTASVYGANSITEGNGAAAALGFTGNPDNFSAPTGYQMGAWSFDDGVMTGTPAPGWPIALCSAADCFGAAWVVQLDAMHPGGATDVTFEAAADPSGYLPGETGSGNGDFGSDQIGAGFLMYTGSPSNGANAALSGGNQPQAVSGATFQPLPNFPPDEWHTIQATIMPMFQGVSFDGTQIFWTASYTQMYQGNGLSRFYLLGFNGVINFRNPKAWRIPVPALS